MRVHSRLRERRRKKRHDEPHTNRLPFIRGTVVCVVGFERCILTGKRGDISLLSGIFSLKNFFGKIVDKFNVWEYSVLVKNK